MTGAGPACAVCHALSDAGSSGAIGPDLDELKPDAARIKKVLQEGMGVMPSFANSMDEASMDAIAAYVVHATGGGRSEEHTSELQALMRISYAVFCLKKKKHTLQR